MVAGAEACATRLDNEIEAYNLPLGCISHLYRDIAARRAGTISKVGLRTFVDPREQGGKINARTHRGSGRARWRSTARNGCVYKAFPINVAFIRGTTGDPDGNITMEREALTLDNLAAAMAARTLAASSSRRSSASRPPIAQSARGRRCQAFWSIASCWAKPANHLQTYGTPYNHAFSGRQRVSARPHRADGA